jgi:hypothetical protein
MVKFAIALVIILVLCVIAGVIRKLRGGTFLPQPERDEDRLFMDKDGRWWRKDPQSGAVVESATVSRRPPRGEGFVETLLCLLTRALDHRSGRSVFYGRPITAAALALPGIPEGP